jgi:NADH dehydrogenase
MQRVLIVGGGFGGIYCAKKLEELCARIPNVELSLVNRQNFFVFTPMLPQIVSGMIESNHVVVPIRQILRRTRFYEADVKSIDSVSKKVTIIVSDTRNGGETAHEVTLDYDHLVVSLGSDTNFMSMPHLEHTVFTLKTLKDALMLRNHIIDMLERADLEPDPRKCESLLNFVIVGGGLSGIETAAELNSFFRKVLKYYPNIRSRDPPILPKVILVHSRERVLPELNEELGTYTLKKMHEDGISLVLNSKTKDVQNGYAKIADKDGREMSIPTQTVIWTAGISPNVVTAALSCEKTPTGRLCVDSYLRAKGAQGIWAVGDCAYIIDEKTGEPYPATAQHALREAEIIGNNIFCELTQDLKGMKKFQYPREATMAVIGEHSAIANVAGGNFSGFLVWLFWRAVYLRKLPMFKKQLRVAIDWTIDAFFDPDLTHLRGLKEAKPAAKISPSQTERISQT